MIRALDRFYAKHPGICAALMIGACFVVLLVAHAWGETDSMALRLQMLSSTSRSST